MPKQNILVKDVQTRWNSSYDMIRDAWEKREVLKAMANDHLNTNKENYKVFLKMLADELLAFCEATQVFSKSRSIRSPNVLGLYELLVKKLDSLIFELDHHLQDFTGLKISNDQAKALRCVYTVMNEKLLK